MCICVCTCEFAAVFLTLHSMYHATCLSVCLSSYTSVCLSLSLPSCLCDHQTTCLSISAYLSVCLSDCVTSGLISLVCLQNAGVDLSSIVTLPLAELSKRIRDGSLQPDAVLHAYMEKVQCTLKSHSFTISHSVRTPTRAPRSHLYTLTYPISLPSLPLTQ